jgi:hypothetical protein
MTGDLSAKAYGILMAIIQHNLNISVDNLRLHFKEGERAIGSGLKELRDNNYIETKKHRIGNRIVTMSILTEKAERLFFGVSPQSVDLQNVGTVISNEHISRITNSTVISKPNLSTKSRLVLETEEYKTMGYEFFESTAEPSEDSDDPKKRRAAAEKKRKSDFDKKSMTTHVSRFQKRHTMPVAEWSVTDVCFEFAERIHSHWNIQPWSVTQSKFSGALSSARKRLGTDSVTEVAAMDLFFRQISISEYKDAEVLWRLFVSRLPGLVKGAVLSVNTDADVLMAEEAWDKAQRILRGEDV